MLLHMHMYTHEHLCTPIHTHTHMHAHKEVKCSSFMLPNSISPFPFCLNNISEITSRRFQKITSGSEDSQLWELRKGSLHLILWQCQWPSDLLNLLLCVWYFPHITGSQLSSPQIPSPLPFLLLPESVCFLSQTSLISANVIKHLFLQENISLQLPL